MSLPASRISSEKSVAAATRSGWLWAALAVAVLALAGSLFLSLGMELKACPLCFYQRTFMMSVVGVLAMGLLSGAGRPGALSLLVLPLGVAGLGVALFHVYLETTGKLECPQGLLAWGSAPKQSLALYVLLFLFLTVDVLGSRKADAGQWVAPPAGLVLGGLLGIASCISNPPLPPAPKEPYLKPADICRPPYQPGELS